VKTRPKRGAANRSDLSAAANKSDLSAAANRRSPSVAARETRGAPRISPVGPRTRSRRAPPTLPTTPEGATTPPGPSGLPSVSLGKSDGQCAASTSRCEGGAQGPARTPPLQRGTPPPAQVTPGLSHSTRDNPEVICLDTPPAMPATSLPATLTTTTVTTVACGGPIMSTLGLPTGGHITSPRPSPASDQQTPPGAVWVTPMERTPIPSGEVERRQQGAVTPSPPPPQETSRDEGDSDGPWRVRLGRRARRRLSSGSSGGKSPPTTSADNNNNSFNLQNNNNVEVSMPNNILQQANAFLVLGTSVASGPSPLDDGGAPGDMRAEDHSAGHPSAPVSVCGVMGRPRGARASVDSGANEQTPSEPQRGGGGHHRRPRRVEVAPVQPFRGQPAPAVAARQRRRQRVVARDALVGRAEAVASLADLEEFAASVALFFGEEAVGVARGDAPGARDRPVRLRAARGRRGEGRVPARDGANVERGPVPAGPQQRQLGEGRGDWTREAKRIQALYRVNRRRAIREVLQGPAEFCRVPTRRVQAYFEDLYRGGERLDNAGAEAERVDPPRREDVELLMAPFTEREVDCRIRRMNNSAPGPDGLTYRDLRAADPGARLLAAFFNACYRLEAVPASWKTSNTVLVHKKDDPGLLENWRPLALGDTTPKLFAALVADRLTGWAINNNKLSPAQKGFLRDEGCFEHNFVLQEILTEARRARRQAVVAWLDLSNAFGSVPHAVIRRALVRAGVPGGLINVWGSMYDGCTTRVRTADGYTAPVPIRSGVRQGCPLSPIVFDFAIDSVLRAVTAVDAGFDLSGLRFSTLAYADDIALVADSPEGMRRLLAAAEDGASSVGLRFNPAKCATLHIGEGAGGRVLPTTFVIQGQSVHHLACGEPYKHLGVPTGSAVDQTPYATIGGLLEDVRAVDRSLLAPWQRVETVAVNLLPRLDFLLRGATVEKRPLTVADKTIRRTAKAWLNLPQRASAEVVYLPPSLGGCGLFPLADLADVLSVAHVFRMLTASDAAVRELAWSSLRGVVSRRIGRRPSNDDIAAFLSGSLEGRMRDGGEKSLWSRARNAARRQSERLSLRWVWSGATGEMIVECRGTRGDTVRVPPEARSQVITRLRSAVMAFYCSRLASKPDQGKVFEVSSRARVSNHFVRGGSFTRFADWRFIHRARLDVLPLNGARRWGEGDKRCRRCGQAAETLPHVICHCGVHSAAIQLRHDAVLHRLWRACRMPGEKRVNQRVEGVHGELAELRPDLVIRHEPTKCVVICDVTVPFENRRQAFHDARARKLAKYSPLAEALRREGYRVVVTAFVVGALGSWDPANEAVLRLLRIGNAYGSMMRRLVVSDSIRWSRDIYVEHVSGVRQYAAPPRPAVDGALATPPRAIRRRWPANRINVN